MTDKDGKISIVPVKLVTNPHLRALAEEVGMEGVVYLDESNPNQMHFIKLDCMRCDRGEWDYKIEVHEKDGAVTKNLYVCEKCVAELEPVVEERDAKIVKVGKR